MFRISVKLAFCKLKAAFVFKYNHHSRKKKENVSHLASLELRFWLSWYIETSHLCASQIPGNTALTGSLITDMI